MEPGNWSFLPLGQGGDFRERSDIDLAVYGMPPENRTSFWLDAEELPTLDILSMWPLNFC